MHNRLTPFAGVRRFAMDFRAFMEPSPAEVAGVTYRAVETFRQSIAADGFVLLGIDTLQERTERYLDRIRASEGTETPFVALATPFYATQEAAKLADDLYRCERCYYVCTVPERCPECGAAR